ncbi:hypothetical protein C8Q70DRAFT_937533 [Cubamyces menziesii]|nr:hypothetical protein C8Q70DRAFT_937533 [Cubamyces menziesii]
MSQASPTAGTPSTLNLSMQDGYGELQNAAQMQQHVGQMNSQMSQQQIKALQMQQRAAMMSQMGGSGGMQGPNLSMNSMSMGGMTPRRRSGCRCSNSSEPRTRLPIILDIDAGIVEGMPHALQPQLSGTGMIPPPSSIPTHSGTQDLGSPQIGAKRKASGTPAPAPGNTSKASTPAPMPAPSATPAPASAPTPPGGTPGPTQMARTSSATGIAGMGITGNVGPPPGSAQPPSPIASGSLVGGAGGGLMPPPVVPRSSGVGDVGVPTIPNVPAAMNRGNLQLNMNAPLVPGMPGMSMAPVPSGAVTGGGPIGMTSPTHVNAGANMGGLGGIGIDGAAPVPVPQTPVRQPSLPPSAVSPFQPLNASGSIPGVIGGGTPTKIAPGMASVTANGKAPVGAAPVGPTTKIIPQLPPLPTTVKLDPKVTRVSVVPLADSEKAIPPLSAEEKAIPPLSAEEKAIPPLSAEEKAIPPLSAEEKAIPPLSAEEIHNVQEWMKADKEYEARYKKMRERIGDELKTTSCWQWKYGSDVAVRGSPRRVPDEDAKRPEQLVPIRLEFDVEHHKMRDTFVWNLNGTSHLSLFDVWTWNAELSAGGRPDPIITPEIFAQLIVDDYGLAPSYHAVITKSIQEQLSDYKAHSATFGEDGVTIDEEEEVVRGKIMDEDAPWWEAWRKRVRSKALYKIAAPPEIRSRKCRKVVKEETAERPDALAGPAGDVPMAVDDFEEDENLMHEEMRILVKLDIIVGSIKLEDQFEWDLENIDPTPEQFAEVYCKDLGLGGEFKLIGRRTAITHSIREQVQIYQKSLFLVGHPSDGSAVQDNDLRMSLLPSLVSGARSMEQVEAFTPTIQYLSESKIEKNEKDCEKELARRKRKTTRGRRGVALPDREPPKTFCTLAIGFPEVSPAALALAAAAAAPTSRRAAAAAASLTITNTVASENGTTILPQSPAAPLTPIAPTSATKEKKPKGLFKPPSYPSSVLRPRANVTMPTPSTAADISTLPPPLEDDLPAPSSSGIDKQGSKVVLTAKRTKEREREAKEREYADGQHANMIDGVWHCSNCDGLESIEVRYMKIWDRIGNELKTTLGFDVEHYKICDTFVSNLDGTSHLSPSDVWAWNAELSAGDRQSRPITPEIFAQSVVDDYDLTPSYHTVITKLIQEQLCDYKACSSTFGGVMINEAEAPEGGSWTRMRRWEAWWNRVWSKALCKMTAPLEIRSLERREIIKEEKAERPDALTGPTGAFCGGG